MIETLNQKIEYLERQLKLIPSPMITRQAFIRGQIHELKTIIKLFESNS